MSSLVVIGRFLPAVVVVVAMFEVARVVDVVIVDAREDDKI